MSEEPILHMKEFKLLHGLKLEQAICKVTIAYDPNFLSERSIARIGDLALREVCGVTCAAFVCVSGEAEKK